MVQSRRSKASNQTELLPMPHASLRQTRHYTQKVVQQQTQLNVIQSQTTMITTGFSTITSVYVTTSSTIGFYSTTSQVFNSVTTTTTSTCANLFGCTTTTTTTTSSLSATTCATCGWDANKHNGSPNVGGGNSVLSLLPIANDSLDWILSTGNGGVVKIDFWTWFIAALISLIGFLLWISRKH